MALSPLPSAAIPPPAASGEAIAARPRGADGQPSFSAALDEADRAASTASTEAAGPLQGDAPAEPAATDTGPQKAEPQQAATKAPAPALAVAAPTIDPLPVMPDPAQSPARSPAPVASSDTSTETAAGAAATRPNRHKEETSPAVTEGLASAPTLPVPAATPVEPATASPKAAVTAGQAAHEAARPAVVQRAPHEAVAVVAEAPDPGAGEAKVSAPLFTQTLDAAALRSTAPHPYAGARGDAGNAAVTLREGRFGADVGVAIARALDGGRDDLLIRIDPRDMGRIDVRLSFDDGGTLRAVVSADSPAVLDLLRRESPHLDRALGDAGIRADAQSLRFDGGQGGGGTAGQQRGGQHQAMTPSETARLPGGATDGAEPILRSLRGSGHVDLMA
ncbi:flagellar hook-length control protein FliK [Novosphingobium resinovorum]|uniref:flagellar hook-length control protein FliK n=1 Tax=Novosphingobium resinovorum TaxID=158500 RepID=UPI002ED2BCB0|nr:flagellar hook-length control protein FliK [Novosphingobium resinovorum]